MEISYFHEFTVLSETLNFWEASERLFMNQSTLSKHIKSMEKELGVELLERTTRQVELTDYGKSLLPYARQISELQFHYSSEFYQKRNAAQGLLTVGSIPSMAQYGITPLFLEYGERYPEFSTKIIEDDPINLEQMLLNRKCDLAFVRYSDKYVKSTIIEDEMIAKIPYVEDHLVAVINKHNPLAKKKEVTLRDLSNEKFCFSSEGSLLYSLCMHACLNAGIVPNIVFDSDRIDSIIDMCSKGNCVALLMDRHVHYPEGSGLSHEVPFQVVDIKPTITSTISLCYLKSTPHSKAAKQFVEFFIDHLEEYPDAIQSQNSSHSKDLLEHLENSQK